MRSKTTQKIITSTPDETRKSVREYANANKGFRDAHNRAKSLIEPKTDKA